MPRATIKCNSAALFRLRSLKGLTQEQVADRASCSKRHYERIESGAPTTLDTLVCIANALECGVDELIDSSGMQAHAGLLGTDLADGVGEHLRKKNVLRRMKTTTMAELLSDSPEGVSLVVRTASKGDLALRLRRAATIGELTHAVAKEYFRDAYVSHDWLLTDADSDAYDITMTVGDLGSHSITVLYLRRHKGLPLAISPYTIAGSNRRARFFRSLNGQLMRLRWHCYALKQWRCKLYLWLFKRSWLNPLKPPRVIIWDMAGMARLYTEANVETDQAIQMVRIISGADQSAKYVDTIAWTCYRAGWYRLAFQLMAEQNPDEGRPPKIKDWISGSYHLHFMCKELGFVGPANAIRHFFMEVIEHDWRQGMYSLRPPLYDLECERVRLSDDAIMWVAADYSRRGMDP